MAEAAIAAQSQAATGASRVNRSAGSSAAGRTAPSSLPGLRPVSDVAGIQRTFTIAQPTTEKNSVTDKNNDKRAGSGLLSTNTQMLLAETRTQEASSSFVPSGTVGPALESYQATYAKVQETIRVNQILQVQSGNNAASINATATPAPNDNNARALTSGSSIDV